MSLKPKIVTPNHITSISKNNVVIREETNLVASFNLFSFLLSNTYFLLVKYAKATPATQDKILAICNWIELSGFKKVKTDI